MAEFLIGYTRGSNIRGRIECEGEAAKTLKGKWCLYESELGVDLARIVCPRKVECASLEKKILGRFIRFINNSDLEKVKYLKEFETEAEKAAKELIKEHHLPMKIIATALAFDEKRLTFYFISEERVDFRALVRDLVSRFHKMIRLQQIGPRDHARIIDGVGICGRGFCCAGFLPEAAKITKDDAYLQGMESLSSDKISGCCGKLLCCLRYEIGGYKEKKDV